MRNPFLLPQPFVVSFSGGRTSGYMLHKIIEANGGIPHGCHVLFANTGKEHEKTLEFIERCSNQWSVPITWLEYDRAQKFKIVDFRTCNRDGKPFSELIEAKKRLPTPPMRFCTSELKLRPIQLYLKSIGCIDPAMSVGLRFDEPRRVHKLKGQEHPIFDHVFPLFDAQVTAKDVLEFWRNQPFDLELPSDSPFINCDLCFLKRASVIARALETEPSRANWWIEQEEKMGFKFRFDRPTLRNQLVQISIQGRLFEETLHEDSENDISCNCTD